MICGDDFPEFFSQSQEWWKIATEDIERCLRRALELGIHQEPTNDPVSKEQKTILDNTVDTVYRLVREGKAEMLISAP